MPVACGRDVGPGAEELERRALAGVNKERRVVGWPRLANETASRSALSAPARGRHCGTSEPFSFSTIAIHESEQVALILESCVLSTPLRPLEILLWTLAYRIIPKEEPTSTTQLPSPPRCLPAALRLPPLTDNNADSGHARGSLLHLQ
jgi:hypothetical protein